MVGVKSDEKELGFVRDLRSRVSQSVGIRSFRIIAHPGFENLVGLMDGTYMHVKKRQAEMMNDASLNE